MAQSTGHVENVNTEGDKLFLRAEVANQDVKNNLWTEIKKIDPQYADLSADISINPALPAPSANSCGNAASRQYTVAAGDSLSAIAERFYGNAREYKRIFEANRSQLSDPDHVRAGQVLVMPG